MEDTLFGIENLDTYLVLGILVIFGILEVMAGYLHRSQRTRSDWIQEMGGFFALSVLIKPAIVIAVLSVGKVFIPSYIGIFSHWSLWLMLPFYLLIC